MTEATARAAHPGFVVAFLGASRMSLAASLLRVCSSGPQEVRDGEFDARGAHLGVDGRRYRGSQTNPDCTVPLVLARMSGAIGKHRLHQRSWDFRSGVCLLLLVSFRMCSGTSLTKLCGPLCEDLAHVGCGRFFTLSQVDQNIVLLSSSASSSARCVELPLSWNKLGGGDLVSWVGFEEAHRSHLLGISTRRAEWFARWTTGSRGAEHGEYDDVRRRHLKIYVRNGCIGP